MMIKLLLPVFLTCGLHIPAFAAVSGSGTENDPLTGQVVAGDYFSPDVYVENLAEEDGTIIYLSSVYLPKHYRVRFRGEGGTFPDGNDETVLEQVYGENISLPADPHRDGKWFAGWYLKGNQRQDIPAEDGTELLSGTSVYLLAADDPEDITAAETDNEGYPIVKALWRNNLITENAGSGADPVSDPGAADLWDEAHSNNHVIEWIPSLPYRADYSRYHGDVRYQYGSIRLDAATDEAVSYTWYGKRAEDTEFVRLDENGSSLMLDGLGREDHGSRYRCVVSVGTQGDSISYETGLTVYWLPKAGGITVKDNGEEVDDEIA